MAVLDSFQVEIIVDGHPAPEYDDDDDTDNNNNNQPNTVTKYIEVASGKEFEFRVRINPGAVWAAADCFCACPKLDGEKHLGRAIEKHHHQVNVHNHISILPIEISLSGQWVGSDSQLEWCKYRFADLTTRETTSQDDYGNPSKMKQRYGNLGVLHLVLWRKKIIVKDIPHKAALSNLDSSRSPGPVPEKALKGKPIHLATTLEPQATATTPPAQCTTTTIDLLPAATFIFKYRTREALQSLMIIPRSPSPPPIVSDNAPVPAPPPPPPAIKDEDTATTPKAAAAAAPPPPPPRPGVKRERGDSTSFRMTTSHPSRRLKTSHVAGKLVYHIDDSEDEDDDNDVDENNSNDKTAKIEETDKKPRIKPEVIDLTCF